MPTPAVSVIPPAMSGAEHVSPDRVGLSPVTPPENAQADPLSDVKPGPPERTEPTRQAPLPDGPAPARPDLPEMTLSPQPTAPSVTRTDGAPVGAGPAYELPQPQVKQLAYSIAQAGTGEIELAMNPEELGRVRLSLSASENSLQVVIQADRPETQDLMRRHIDQLGQEMRSLGYRDVSFAFGHDNRRAPQPMPDGPSASDQAMAEPEIAPLGPARRPALGRDLDILL
ncbi:flagellar hook-length control protein FliK [Actibacterium sp. XHP0104]|uniref:flagellar hook-length control protein FliK n=1 Tax=Actibacterium sp. XHP0104 TaxID=2984335 RepID=UPI0021E9043D|nr:flagellar hook-length control protein FliK [Actibacterium sp. XHP0104]MCV2881791.1 flagellar hook-length control protein FliK [Actibacterium sp. XHP0104]